MLILRDPIKLRDYLEQKKIKKKQTGFVPTMGALHTGHLSLIGASVKNDDITICSIFVNPTQFNDPEDYKKYPVTIEKDIQLLANSGCHILFLPSIENIYPQGLTLLPKYDLGFLQTVLEGKFRPGHFQGVCQVMNRLLDIVRPEFLYLGRKDYQQCMVIKKLVQLMGLSELIRIVVCPTLREADGLAMSSRNTRLSPDERKRAVVISAALRYIRQNLEPGNTMGIKEKAAHMIAENGFNVEYVEISDAETLQPVYDWNGHQKIVALAAAYINKVRLIDNLEIN